MFTWYQKEIDTLQDAVGAIRQAVEWDSEEAAEDLIEVWAEYLRREGHHNSTEAAMNNIGYCTGFLDPEEAKAARKLFEVHHPVFGDYDPTPEEAFAAGVQWGKEMRDGKASVKDLY